jgi:RNA methyltransferase, TrmH family
VYPCRPVTIVTSRQHALVKTCRALARGDAGTRALIDGWHLLHEAVTAGLTIDTVALAGKPPSDADRALVRALDVVEVSRSVIDAMSPVRSPSGVVAIVQKKHHTIEAALAPSPALLVVAVGLQDPGNAGAVVRAAEAGGATGVVLGGESADPWGWKALRAAMGSTFRFPVIASRDLLAPLDAIAHAAVPLIATVPRGGQSLYDLDLRGPAAVLIGGEGSGLPVDVIDRATARLTIPMAAPVESLNAAVAAALVIYEAARQRRSASRVG